jgi:hypothetical protein
MGREEEMNPEKEQSAPQPQAGRQYIYDATTIPAPVTSRKPLRNEAANTPAKESRLARIGKERAKREANNINHSGG